MISAFPETGSNHVKQSRGKTSSPGLPQQLRLRPPASAHSPSTGAFAFQERDRPLGERGFGGGWRAWGEATPLGTGQREDFPQKTNAPCLARRVPIGVLPKNIMTATWRKAPHHPRARCCPHHIPAARSGPAAGHVPFPRSCGSGPWRPCARSRRAG